ncbi:undecaprenyl-diphosphatase UppP [Candidatus Saccharibacteria bacterium]|jgi:undecaprenyl-diphosphatase|nr:undecaprenyl-diphosphatase UppP [Candidatus Saccharibacteria bacterium]
MSIIEAIVLGLVQGLTEFIPVSSSGHLIIAHELFGTTDSTLVFDVALHIGTLLALMIFFWKDILGLMKNVFAKNTQGKLSRIIIVGTIPAGLIGYLFSDWIDDNLRKPITVVITMIIMGLLMLAVEKYSSKKRTVSSVTMQDGVKIGFAQALALIPGVSRSGATITTGMIQGLKRADSARLSFLMAIPITAGAIAGSLLGAEQGELSGQTNIFAIGILMALVSGLFAIRFLLRFLSNNSLSVFAYYRIALAVIVFLTLV